MMEIDKSTLGTLEDQMFYRRIALKELTGIRHDNPTDEDFMFTTIATINRLQENIQWWYMSCDVCNKIATKESHNYYCKNCDTYPEGLTPRYRIQLQISDRTATTSCTLFDEEDERMLNTSVSFLLDSLDGKFEELPKIIQELCGQRLIFRFKLNNKNLTLGMQNYAVKKIFAPDEKLEKQYLEDKAEEDLMDDEVDNMLKRETKKPNEPVKKVQISKCELSKNICELVPVKEEPKDKRNGSTVHEKE
uniref:Replication factor A C-terminal domain-containing protein n=1 Tax=Triticum urartu TaxID=4572 RepID=A0A8R7TJ74_TRIUA